MKARIKTTDGQLTEIPLSEEVRGSTVTVTPKPEDWSAIDYIEIGYDIAEAKVGEEGYYVVPRGGGYPVDHLTYFLPRDDTEKNGGIFVMNFFGAKIGKGGFCAIVTGGTFEYQLVTTVKDGIYSLYPRFYLGGKPLYEEIRIEYHFMESADYNDIAKVYRTYMLNEGGCKRITDRLTPALDYARESLYIRIRMAWKPVPSPIEEQTIENEPPLYVACTFDRVGEFMDRLKASGVEKAEFCLVGWNKSGHDGRWPQMLPVEPKLGGEEGLKRLIAKAKALGYQITCHTNCSDSYSIADNYDAYWTRKKKDGTVSCHPQRWSGGLARQICPIKGEEYVHNHLPDVKRLGFYGLHYIDVMTTLPLFDCFDKNHPVNRRECQKIYQRIGAYSREMLGGYSSEGGYDFSAPVLDYALYVSFYDSEAATPVPFLDEVIPLWELVYHGIIMSNPYSASMTFVKTSPRHQLECIEHGARQVDYIHRKFTTGGDGICWESVPDLRIRNEAEISETVDMIAKQYREYLPMAKLQSELMEKHEILPDNCRRVTYSDGTVVTCDYNTMTYSVKHS